MKNLKKISLAFAMLIACNYANANLIIKGNSEITPLGGGVYKIHCWQSDRGCASLWINNGHLYGVVDGDPRTWQFYSPTVEPPITDEKYVGSLMAGEGAEFTIVE